MSTLTKTQQDAILVLRTRLNPDDPCNKAAPHVKAHLRAIDSWLDTWVRTAVEALNIPVGYEHRWIRDAVNRDAGLIRLDQERLKAEGKL